MAIDVKFMQDCSQMIRRTMAKPPLATSSRDIPRSASVETDSMWGSLDLDFLSPVKASAYLFSPIGNGGRAEAEGPAAGGPAAGGPAAGGVYSASADEGPPAEAGGSAAWVPPPGYPRRGMGSPSAAY